MNKLHIPCSTGCFVCGFKNSTGLQAEFYAEDSAIIADIAFKERFTGFPHIAHGGVLASLVDESMGWAAYIFSDSKNMFVTRKLEVTYKKMAPLGEPLKVSASLVGIERGLLYSTKAKIEDSSGKLLISAVGQFFPINDEKMAEVRSLFHFHDGYSYHPKALLLKNGEKL